MHDNFDALRRLLLTNNETLPNESENPHETVIYLMDEDNMSIRVTRYYQN